MKECFCCCFVDILIMVWKETHDAVEDDSESHVKDVKDVSVQSKMSKMCLAGSGCSLLGVILLIYGLVQNSDSPQETSKPSPTELRDVQNSASPTDSRGVPLDLSATERNASIEHNMTVPDMQALVSTHITYGENGTLLIFSCPYCDATIMVHPDQIHCAIFRHGVYESDDDSDEWVNLPPHASYRDVLLFKQQRTVYGCGGPFKIIQIGGERFATTCSYNE